MEHSLLWNFRSLGAKVPRTFVPMKLYYHENEYFTNFRYKCHKTRPINLKIAYVHQSWNESSWNIRPSGAKVPGVRKFHGTKVARERKFSLWSFCSLERKRRGTKKPVTDARSIHCPLIQRVPWLETRARFPSEYRHLVWHGKTWMAWLPDGELQISLFVLAQLTNVTDRRTRHTMTPNKLAVYFVADMVLAYMVVADINFPCGRYRFLLWTISSCGRYGCTPVSDGCFGYIQE